MVAERRDFNAMHDLTVGGVAGYREGDNVPWAAVENQGFVIGEDVLPASPDVIPHPGAEANRRQLAEFAMGQGLTPDEANELGAAELRERYPAPKAEETPGQVPLRPATSDNKAAWVEHAVGRGLSREVAEASTKDQLMTGLDDLIAKQKIAPPPEDEKAEG